MIQPKENRLGCDTEAVKESSNADSTTATVADYAEQYDCAGFGLCLISAGRKFPTYKEWGTPARLEDAKQAHGLGLIHTASRTCAIDLDDLHQAAEWLQIKGIDLSALLNADDGVQIVSGRPNRGKLLYKLPDGCQPLPTKKVQCPDGSMMLEFRCAPGKGGSDAVQDVLPPTIHPDTGKPYQWGGNGDFNNLPTLPDGLLTVWREMLTNAPKVESKQTANTYTIAEGGRNDALYRKGGDLARAGISAAAIEAALQVHNSEKCQPPLPATEVASIARSAAETSNGAKDALAYSPEHHPLAKFLDFDLEPKPPVWVIPGFVAAGVAVIAGAPGVGKTTGLAPLAMIAAGLHEAGNPLAPKQWRHVVYITEDTNQLERIIAGVVRYGGKGITVEAVKERLHVVDAKRLPPAMVAAAGVVYRARFTREVGGVMVLPLVVIDTMAATLELESENDNAEASGAMSVLKQGFDGLPVWLIGHLAKTELTRTNVKGLSVRGAGAFAADANQSLFMVEDEGTRYLVRGKTRFEARWNELQFDSGTAEVESRDVFGDPERVYMRWGWPEPVTNGDRAAAAEKAKDAAAKAAVANMRQSIMDAVATAWNIGNPLNISGLRGKVSGKAQTVSDTIQALIADGWLHQVQVPRGQQQHPRRDSYLICLTAEEHDLFTSAGVLPDAKMVIPVTWKKSVSSVPGDAGDAVEMGVSEGAC
ncbi:AAA family ATPase [Brachymonas chironomi]|uniref:AAA family ATPase n=1 Tax=Brachymonas chironomi TaxID=491919 RepID=UPI00037326F8|nr:AAA family ATPase [Brachymonas chironomi]